MADSETSLIPTIGAQEFLDRWHPNQGEHVTIIGPTGSGKTRLANRLLAGYPYTVQIVSKPSGKDRSVDTRGATVIDHWPPQEPTSKVILWPKWKTPSDVKSQAAKIRTAIDDIFSEGAWAVLIDDALYVVNVTKAGATLDLMWYHGRSAGLSLLTCWPRPRWAPRLAYSAATHLFLFLTKDVEDLRALAQISGAGAVRPFSDLVRTLGRFEAVYVNTRTSEVSVVKLRNQI